MNNTVNRASLGAKKNFKFFKSGFCEKLKLLLIPIGLLIASVPQAKAWYSIMSGEDIYFDAVDQYTRWELSSKNLYMKVYYGDNQGSSNIYKMTQISGSKLYYSGSAQGHTNVSGIEFFSGSDDGKGNYTYSYGTGTIKFNGWSNVLDRLDRMCYTNSTSTNWSWSGNIDNPPLSTISLAKYNTTTYGGDGSYADPYLVAAGSAIQVQVTSTKRSSSLTAKYKFTVDATTDGDYTESTTKTAVASAADGTTYAVSVQGWGYSNSNYSRHSITSNIVYFRGIASYQLNYSVGSVAGNNGSISTSPTTASGSYIQSGNTITLTAPAAKAGYSWKGWYTNAAGTDGKIADTDRAITITMNADKTLYACYTENNYTVSVVSSDATNAGTVASGSVTGHVSTSANLPTATPKFGYRFVNWQVTTGTASITNSTSASGATINGMTADCTVRANFTRVYAFIEGRFHVQNAARSSWTNTFNSGNWDANSANIPFEYDGTYHHFILHTHATPKELSTQFNISSTNYDPLFFIKLSKSSSNVTGDNYYTHYYSATAQTLDDDEDEKKALAEKSGADNNLKFSSSTTSGYAAIYFDGSDIWYELEQRLQYNGNGSTGGSAPATHNSYYKTGTNATAATNTYTKTGYRFTGWKTEASGGTSYAEGATVPMSADVTLYAQWAQATTTISFNADGGSEIANQTATYGSAMPSISKPTKEGYTLVGIYDAEDGGTQYYNENGASARNWDKEDASTTLYVRWAENHTVSIAAQKGGEAISEYTPVSPVTANTTLPIEVSAPEISGYTFANWTLGSNITKSSGELTDNPIHITATANSTLTANYNYTNYVITYPDAATAHCVYADGKSTSLDYKSQGTFTVTPAAGYSIEVSANVDLTINGNTYTFTQGTTAVVVTITPTELTNTVTVVNGTPTSVTAQVATAVSASVTADPAPAGKKFGGWSFGDGGITLVTGTESSRTITFHASQETTITAMYVDRTKKTVHFAKPYGWSTVTAVFSNSGSSPSSKMTAEGTFTYGGATYYTFSYFVDDTGEDGGDQSAQADWNQVVFSDNGSNEISAITFTDGYYYAKGVTTGRSTPFAEWYLRGNLNSSENWDEGDFYKYPFSVEGSTLEYAYGATTGSAQYFRLYRTSTAQWFRTSSTSGNVEITTSNMETPTTFTLAVNGSNADYISTPAGKMGVYLFTLTNLNSATPSLTITHPEDTKYDLTEVTAGAHGSLSGGTESIEELGRYMPTTISATADAGYRFKEWVTTGGVVVANPTSASTTATATAAGTLKATFTNEGIVYLDKSAISSAWAATPYVYFYSGSYWNAEKGSGSLNILSGGHAMTRIGDTNIWYYDYSGDPGISNSKNYISFTNGNKSGQGNFDETSAIYRGDFYPEMNTYVPQNNITHYLNKHDNKQTAYYNSGYWMKYNDAEAGYKLLIYDGQGHNLQQVIPFVNTDYNGERDEYTATLHVDGAAGAKFELIGYDQDTVNGVSYSGTYYGNAGSINSDMTSWWEYTSGGGKQTYVNLISKGDYVFTLKCGEDGKIWVKVTYPLVVGDFRVKYDGLITTTADSKSSRYSDAIPRLTTDGTRVDTVSFFVHNSGDNTATLSAEKVSSIASDGKITWVSSDISLTGADISSLTTDVYTFKITQTKSGASHTLAYESLGAYSGNYYVRTDCAQGGWVAYKQDDHIMKPTTHDDAGYNSYFVRYVSSGSVKFCIANQYNSELTEQKVSDINTNAEGTIQAGANTRFEYDTTTNVVSRSYIGSSDANTFLYIIDANPEKIKTKGGASLTPATSKFADQENWVYMLEVQVEPGAEYQLAAVINGNTQYFDGTETEQTLLGGSGDWQYMRLVYDFKNNHMTKAWVPGATVSGNIAINADVMLLRRDQEDATQLSFANDKSSLTSVKKVYGVLGFQKTTMIDGDLSSQERSLYWVSFPFDVKLKDVFGFGTYGEDFIIRRYNGAKRAEIGWFMETSTFWETMDPDSEEEAENTMKAYEGYMVALDKGLFSSDDPRWKADGKDISEINLYFPSEVNVGTLTQKSITIDLPEMLYPHDRYFTKDAKELNHKNTDSNWRVIGVGSLNNSTLTATETDGSTSKAFDFYEWNATYNSLAVKANAQVGGGNATTFNAGHAVMVQWAGKITWVNASVPSSVAARNKQEKKNYDIELDLNYNDEKADRTYVILKEDASPDFVLNEDVYKVTNSNLPNIYAYAGSYDCGISRVPVASQSVPVGVIIRKAGTYTFSMPSNFDGEATLVDTYTNKRTNLAIGDYEVNLPKGTINDRFVLDINIKKVATAIDGTEGGSLKDGKAHKFIENGVMYILRDGKIYDARGNKVK